ncbi:MAG: hypothetical protein WBQ08_18865 [Candidatus Sulfotelmatobacter sp.]
MIQRCTNLKDINYPQYGGSGVTVAPEWMTFAGFLTGLGPRPEGMTLGRILDMGDYTSGNAFWMTMKEQMLNRRNKRALKAWAVSHA